MRYIFPAGIKRRVWTLMCRGLLTASLSPIHPGPTLAGPIRTLCRPRPNPTLTQSRVRPALFVEAALARAHEHVADKDEQFAYAARAYGEMKLEDDHSPSPGPSPSHSPGLGPALVPSAMEPEDDLQLLVSILHQPLLSLFQWIQLTTMLFFLTPTQTLTLT